MFGGLTVERAAIVGGIGNRQLHQLPTLGTWYWWWINRPIGDVELRRQQRLGVQVRWPHAQAGASALVDGPDAQFQVARGCFVARPVAHAALPFDLRSRAALWETPFRPRKA